MLDLNDLRLFVGIADQQGIVKAGRLFNLPKSTMSRRLSALEDQVKGQLVIRNSEEFRLTELGKELYDIGKSMLEITQLAENVVDDKKVQIAGKVSLSVSPLIGELVFRSWSHIEGPFQTLSLTIDISDRSIEGSLSFSDLHVVAHSWQLRDNAFVQRRICRNPLLIVAAPDLNIASPQTEGGILKLPHRLFSYGRDPEETTFICHSAWNKDPLLGVIGIQTGPLIRG